MPVTRDPRYIEICAKVNRANIKVGKAKDFAIRNSNYWKEFDEENVLFEPLVELDDIVTAERAILRALVTQNSRKGFLPPTEAYVFKWCPGAVNHAA